jgi:hypothetical protein
MVSESARMSSAQEARYRVQAPNSLPRTIKIVALDPRAETVLRSLALSSWQRAVFYTASSFTRDLETEVATADLVIMVAGPGGGAQEARTIGAACSARRVNTTALIVGAADASDEALAPTLAQVRPWSLVVVIANNDDYIHDMLTALRA